LADGQLAGHHQPTRPKSQSRDQTKDDQSFHRPLILQDRCTEPFPARSDYRDPGLSGNNVSERRTLAYQPLEKAFSRSSRGDEAQTGNPKPEFPNPK
jgi:hypothetical protein